MRHHFCLSKGITSYNQEPDNATPDASGFTIAIPGYDSCLDEAPACARSPASLFELALGIWAGETAFHVVNLRMIRAYYDSSITG